METLKNQIRKLISQDKLKQAIETLITHFEEDEALNEILIQAARYRALRKDEMGGAVPKPQINEELNSLRRNILSFPDRIDEKEAKEPGLTGIESYETEVRFSLTRVVAAKILLAKYQEEECMDITSLLRISKLKSRKLLVDFLKELDKYDLVTKEKKSGKTCWKLNQEGKQFLEKIIE